MNEFDTVVSVTKEPVKAVIRREKIEIHVMGMIDKKCCKGRPREKITEEIVRWPERANMTELLRTNERRGGGDEHDRLGQQA